MELKGVVIFKLSNVGSQSECVLPYLYVGKGEFIKIYMFDDNPFENNMLKEYDSKFVKLSGDYNDYGTFVIEEISLDLDEKQDAWKLVEDEKEPTSDAKEEENNENAED